MIRVIIERNAADRTIRAFSVEGHANFAEAGKDIVCAGVSAVTVGTVNAVEALLGIALDTKVESGFLRARVPGSPDRDINMKLQLLLESMVVMLQSIQDSYGQYINLKDKFI